MCASWSWYDGAASELEGTTLRYDYEVRDEGDYFDEIGKVALPDEMLDLAEHIIKDQVRQVRAEEVRGPLRGRAGGADQVQADRQAAERSAAEAGQCH
jgi:non-homologous end joining protein Ku